MHSIITSLVSSGGNRIALVCVCASVCNLALSRPNSSKYEHEFWYGGSQRSRTPRQKCNFWQFYSGVLATIIVPGKYMCEKGTGSLGAG